MRAETLPPLESIPKEVVTEEWLDRKDEFETQVRELLEELPAISRRKVIVEINKFVDELYDKNQSDVLSMRDLGKNLASEILKVIEEAR